MARRFGFSADKNVVLPIYVLRLKDGRMARTVYESEMRRTHPV